jgi:cell division protein FtsI/penicillin-binding protein 2
MNSIKRVKIVKFILSLAFVTLFIYVFMLQTFYAKKYDLQAKRQQSDSIPLLAERGKILDTKFRPLVYNQLCSSIRILPKYVRCRDSVATLLASYELKPENEIIDELNTKSGLFWFKKFIDYQVANRLKKDLHHRQFDNSVIVADDLKRIYPFGSSIASVTGIMGDETGLSGLEFSFDSILKGKPGWIILQKDATGNDYYWPSYPQVQPINGSDVVLTIDLEMQEIAYKNLVKCVDSFQAIRGSVLILDANDGSILAMCDYPDFDPQNFRDYPSNLWTPFAISDEFEPGSVYKLVICATALTSNAKDTLLERKYDVSKNILISGKKIKDVHNNGVLTFDDIFIKSSNIGVSLLSQMLSAKDFYVMERSFGLSFPTGIEMSGEANGFVDRPKQLTQLRFANNAFGQGVRATLLQLSMAYLSIAQNGKLLKPYIVKQINNNGKTIYQGEKKIVRQVLDEKTALMIKDILARAVIDGTGRAAALDEYQVCGKTGTAQKLEPDGRYSDKKSIMTFIGFFPKDNPRYLIATMVDEPKFTRFAGEVTCPLFQKIANEILRAENPKTSPSNNDIVIH